MSTQRKIKTVSATVINRAIREGAEKLPSQCVEGLAYTVVKCQKRGLIRSLRM